MRPPSQLVQVGGRRVAAEDAGPAWGFPVIVHHGGTRHLSSGAVRDAQAHGLRLISYDRPGQGMSAPQPGRMVADCAADMRAILAQLGISRAAVCGTSVGDAYALATAALLPGAITSVCVFAPLALIGAPGLDFTDGMSEGQSHQEPWCLRRPRPAPHGRGLLPRQRISVSGQQQCSARVCRTVPLS